MSGPPVPRYGNFGGNGDNDAWEQADRYATFAANNYNIATLVGGPPGSGTLPDPRDYYAPITVHINRAPENVTLVKAVLADIDRQPKNDVDTAYLNHDLGFVPDSAIANIANNNTMGASVWVALTTSGGIDPLGYVYGAASVPFIIGPGSVFNVLTEVKAQTNTSPTFVADTVYVTAEMERSGNLIDVFFSVAGSNSTINSVVTFAKETWSDAKSALGSGWADIKSSLSGAWDWFKDKFFRSDYDDLSVDNAPTDHDEFNLDLIASETSQTPSLWGDVSGLELQYTKVSAGDLIETNALSGYDDNGDGYLTLDDAIVANLGISEAISGLDVRAFTAEDSIDVTTGRDQAGEIVEILARLQFFNVTTVGKTNFSSSDEISLQGELAEAFGVAQQIQEPWLI